MYDNFKNHLDQQLKEIHEAGLYKSEREITSPQGAKVTVLDGKNLINLCANNYLGLADNSDVTNAAQKGLNEWGYGMASVRFICGTQTLHKQL